MLLSRSILFRVSGALDVLLVVDPGSFLLGLDLGLVIAMVNLLFDLVLLVNVLGRENIPVLYGLNGSVVMVLVDFVVNVGVNPFVFMGLDVLVHDWCSLFLVDCRIVGGLDGLVNRLVECLCLFSASGLHLCLALLF